jgi:uncharacterized protein
MRAVSENRLSDGGLPRPRRTREAGPWVKGILPEGRPSKSERRFTSQAVERAIREIVANAKDPAIGWLFSNCFPNTLDTTVEFSSAGGKPDTFVITGDIEAMWLRDSTAQVWPYLAFAREDKNLQALIKGVIHRQTRCVLLDRYANAFMKDPDEASKWQSDHTEMKPGVHERKWEVDSLCYPIRLAYGYWKATGDISVFDPAWVEAIGLVLQTFREQQRFENSGPYRFERTTACGTDTVALGGYGYPGKPNGLIFSSFRPSDDATVFPYFIPGNFFAVVSLAQLTELLNQPFANQPAMATEADSLRTGVETGLRQAAFIEHPEHGRILAFEVNGFGSYHLMDDANVPSLISLPYLGAIDRGCPVYQNTRKFALSESNPFFYRGNCAEGVGSPHTGINTIWPMSIIMRAMTSVDDDEIATCIQFLKATHADTGWMHESFHKDNPFHYTRKWFAWANTLFGELIWKVYHERKHLIT